MTIPLVLLSIASASASSTNPPLARSSLMARSICASAMHEAELRHGLPEGLLQAISVIESGRHPYAINLGADEGARYPEHREEAHALLASSVLQGGRPMAGCLQINVVVHSPQDPSWALEPRRAADWAAVYLTTTARSAGLDQAGWQIAVAKYQGGRGVVAERYLCRLAGALNGLGHTRTEWLLLGNMTFDDEAARRRCENAWRVGAVTATALRTPIDKPVLPAGHPLVAIALLDIAEQGYEQPGADPAVTTQTPPTP
jgi:hypothetical protein